MGKCKTGVYGVRNIVNGKIYVGSSSSNIVERMSVHRRALQEGRHDNPYLQNSWNKYGSSKFEISIIEICPPEDCINREQYWIDQFTSFKFEFGYNRSPTAGSCLGFKHSKTTILKMKKRMKGVPMPDWVKNKIRIALTGKPKTDNHKANLWKNRQGWKHSEESKKKVSESLREHISNGGTVGWNKGQKHSEETKLKMSMAGKGRPKSVEHKAKIKAAHIARANRLRSQICP